MNAAGADEDRLLDHDYDGIQEYDNPMPRWWVLIFWAHDRLRRALLRSTCPASASARGGSPTTTPTWRPPRAKSAPAGRPAGPTDERSRCAGRRHGGARRGKTVFTDELRGLPRAGRRRPDRPEPHRRLLDPRRHARRDPRHGRRTACWPRACRRGARCSSRRRWTRSSAYVISLHGTTPAKPKAPEGVEEPPAAAPRRIVAKEHAP